MTVKKSKLKQKIKEKKMSLFDHVNMIKEKTDINYFDKLSEEDRKTFNRYMILRVLSMNKKIIDIVSDISRYFDKIQDDRIFCKLLMSKIPKDFYFHKYIKSSVANVNSDLINVIQGYYNISYNDAVEYYKLFIINDNNLNELIMLLEECGKSDKEIDKLFKNKIY